MSAEEIASDKEANGNRCVLFDLDGTLYDSPEYSQKVEEETARFVSEEFSTNFEDAKVHPAKELGIRIILLDRTGEHSARWADVALTNLCAVPTIAKQLLPCR